jgi:hypothetical protein
METTSIPPKPIDRSVMPVTFAGYARWLSSSFDYAWETQEQKMDEACATVFPGSSSVYVNQILAGLVEGLPEENDSGLAVVPKCGGQTECFGEPTAASKSGFANLCVLPNSFEDVPYIALNRVPPVLSVDVPDELFFGTAQGSMRRQAEPRGTTTTGRGGATISTSSSSVASARGRDAATARGRDTASAATTSSRGSVPDARATTTTSTTIPRGTIPRGTTGSRGSPREVAPTPRLQRPPTPRVARPVAPGMDAPLRPTVTDPVTLLLRQPFASVKSAVKNPGVWPTKVEEFYDRCFARAARASVCVYYK